MAPSEIHTSNRTTKFHDNWRELGMWTLGACTEKSDKDIYSIDYTGPVCIILGSEKDGISQNLIDISHEKAKIPMLGKIDSLNVSSSSAVILYELIRQRN